MNFLVFF
jgi:hypothetical protein